MPKKIALGKLIFETVEGNGYNTEDMTLQEANEIFEYLGGADNWLAKILIREAEEEKDKQIEFKLPDVPAGQLVKEIIIDLDSKYKSELTSVELSNDVKESRSIYKDGTKIILAQMIPEIVVHEFAHSLSSILNGYGFIQFQKELKKLHEEYIKAVEEDPENSISDYADDPNLPKGYGKDGVIDEWMAEAFTLAYNNKKGNKTPYIEINSKNIVWALRVKQLIDSYYLKENHIIKR